MQVRWNYKLDPNQQQMQLMEEWLVTLRKHRNACLRERKESWDTNNQAADQPIHYAFGAYCDLDTHIEVGATCPLTCPVVKHGVIAEVPLTRLQSEKVAWDSASGIQSKRTTQLRHENPYYNRIDSDVLQRNLAKLDAAYQGFWKHQRGFPAFRTRANFNSFEYKPKRVKFQVMQGRSASGKHRYSRVYLPGIGTMRYFDSRAIPKDAAVRTVTVKREADGWYLSVLLNLAQNLPAATPIEQVSGINGIDVGINQWVASSDGSLTRNPRFASNRKAQRLLRIRQRRTNRKQKGSKNRAKAGRRVAKFHRTIAQKREAYQWQVANQEVNKAGAIAHEMLNIQGMKKRCKPIRSKGRFLPNGQSAKRGLNRAIADAAWGELFAKIGWIALKQGKPVLQYHPVNTSRECSACGHISADNRDGEKFLCENCGHIDHADTQAARNGLRRVGLSFVRTRRKNLPGTLGK